MSVLVLWGSASVEIDGSLLNKDAGIIGSTRRALGVYEIVLENALGEDEWEAQVTTRRSKASSKVRAIYDVEYESENVLVVESEDASTAKPVDSSFSIVVRRFNPS